MPRPRPSSLSLRAVLGLALAVLALGACKREPPLTLERVAARTPPLPRETVAQVMKATVGVVTRAGSGTGFRVADVDGHALIVTSDSVLHSEGETIGPELGVVFPSEPGASRTLPASLVVREPASDLAVLRVANAPEGPALPLGPAKLVAKDSPLYAFGFPGTVHPGLPVPSRFWERAPEGLVPLVVGLQPGHSGGPVVDGDGRVRGVAVVRPGSAEAPAMVPTELLRGLLERQQASARLQWQDVPAPIFLAGSGAVKPPNTQTLAHATVRVLSGTTRGGGFVVGRLGTDAVVLTNHHTVHGPDGARLSNVQVSATSPSGAVHTVGAEVLRSSKEEDVAILRARALDVTVPALELKDAEHLSETQHLWMVGPVLGHGLVSARHGAQGRQAALLQVHLGLTEENTGGPVVDVQGNVVGLAVLRHPRLQAGAVVPGSWLRALMAGTLRGGGLKLHFDGQDRCLLELLTEVTDPLGNLATFGLDVEAPDAQDAASQASRTVRRGTLEGGVGRLSAMVVPCLPGTLNVQVWVEGRDGERLRSAPVPVPVAAHARGYVTAALPGTEPSDSEPVRLEEFFATPPPRVPGWSKRCPPDAPTVCEVQCAAGEALSCLQLGDLAYGGTERLPEDEARAKALYRTACKAGAPEACDRLATYFPDSLPSESSPQRMLELYQPACESGLTTSCFSTGLALWRLGDFQRAVQRFEQACAAGEPRACTMLGVAHEKGQGVPEANAGAADQAYRRGCKALVPQACHNAGLLAARGKLGAEQLRPGVALLRDTCARDFAPSCNDLGVLASRNRAPGISQTPKELFQRACQLGAGAACMNASRTSAHTPYEEFGTLELGFQAPLP